MKKKVNLFFVESPLQLISATQARDCLNICDSIIFINIREKYSNNHIQILNELDSNWGSVHFFYKKNIFLRWFFFSLFLCKLYIKYNDNVEHFFYGEYRNPDYAIYETFISPSESILLDDGTVTIAIQKEFIKKGKSIFEIKGFKNTVFKKVLIRARTPNLYSFFDLSMFMLPEQVNYYRNIMKSQQIFISNCYYFVGSKLSEAGYMEEGDELSLLNVIFKTYNIKEFYYIPHRGESENKIRKIKEIGFIVKKLNQPLETFYNSTNSMPKKLISYYSTALYTCYLRFNTQVDLIAIDVRKYLTSQVSLENVNTIYDYYADIGIKIKPIKL